MNISEDVAQQLTETLLNVRVIWDEDYLYEEDESDEDDSSDEEEDE